MGTISQGLANPRVQQSLTLALVGIAVIALGVFIALNPLTAYNATIVVVSVTALGALLLLLWAWPRWLLGLTSFFLFSQPLLIGIPNSTYNVTKVIYSVWFISLLLVLWAVRMLIRRDANIELTRLVWPALALMGAMLLSLINAETFWGDFQYVVLFIYFAAFGIFVANLAQGRADVTYLLGSLLASAGVAAAYGLFQYFGVLPGAADQGANAIISTFGNRNYLGGFLVYLYAPGLLLALFGRSRWLRIGAIATLSLLYVSFIAINSQSVWLAWLVSLAVIAVGVLISRQWRPLKASWPWLAGLVAATVVLTLGFNVANALQAERDGTAGPNGTAGPSISSSAPFLEQAAQFSQNPALFLQAARTLQMRLVDWIIGYDMFANAPIVGVGIGDYKRHWLDYKSEFYPTEMGQSLDQVIGRHLPRAVQAHNEYVQIGAEMGIIGVGAMLAFVVVLVAFVIRRLRHPNDDADANAGLPPRSWVALTVAAGIAAFLSDSVFSFPLHLPPNALAFAALLGLLGSHATGPGQVRFSLRGRGTTVFTVSVVVVALVVSFFAYRVWMADIYLQAGAQLLSNGDTRGVQLIQRSIKLDIAPGKQYYWLGALYTFKGKPDRALPYLRKAHPVFKTEYSYYLLALANYYKRNMDATMRYANTLLDMEPHPMLKEEADYLRAVVLSNRGKTEEAMALFRDLLDSNYQPVKVHINIAEVYRQRQQTSDAVSHLNKAMSLIRNEQQTLSQKLDVNPEATSSTDPARNPDLLRYYELNRLKQRVDQLMDQLQR